MLDHEKLDVYKRSIEFFSLSVQIIEKIPKGNANLSDQLKRASLSIPLNIAERVGKIGNADKKTIQTSPPGFNSGLNLRDVSPPSVPS